MRGPDRPGRAGSYQPPGSWSNKDATPARSHNGHGKARARYNPCAMAHKDSLELSTASAQPARRVELHRRVAVIRPGKIHVRPSRRAMLGPLTGFLLGL